MKKEFIEIDGEDQEVIISGNDIFIEDDLAEKIVKNISKSIKNEKTNIMDDNTRPIIKKHTLLNFKGIKKLSFNNFNKDFKPFSWGSIINLLSADKPIINMNVDEASFRANYLDDSFEFHYTKNVKIIPIIYKIDKNRFNKNFITDLFEYLNPPSNSVKIVEEYNDHDLVLKEFSLAINDDLYMCYDSRDLTFFINPGKHLEESDSNPFYLFLRLLMSYKNSSQEANKIHIVYKADYGFDKLAFDVKKINVDIEANYNDGFKETIEEIIKNLNNKNTSGLYILYGAPGCGKTSCIRYLATKVKRNIIFISPDMVEYITDPSFVPFLMENNDSILIIEDAEPALQKRDGSSRTGAISNILNLTDGLLSDCLNISIVATFNTNTKTLDDALLREGRLINSYQFEKLSIEKSKKLLKTLGHDVDVKAPMTLAEIYYYGKDNKSHTLKLSNKKIGFGS